MSSEMLILRKVLESVEGLVEGEVLHGRSIVFEGFVDELEVDEGPSIFRKKGFLISNIIKKCF